MSRNIGVIVATCIYCEKNDAGSREHWLPQWMGAFRDADVLRDRLCDACNVRLGHELDNEMARNSPEALDRYRRRLGDSRTDWEQSNPFNYRTQRAEPPTRATVTFPDDDHPLLMEDIPGSMPPRRRALQQIVVRDAEGKGHPVRLPTNCTAAWLREALRQRGLEGGRLAEIVCELEEGRLPAWARRTLNEVFPGARDIESSSPEGGPELNLTSALQIDLHVSYYRALAKLAFHYALKQCPYLDGHDPAFAVIRDFVLNGEGKATDIVDLNAPTFLLRDLGRRFDEDGHFFFLEMDNQHVSVSMKLFAGSHYKRPAIGVALGPDPSPLVRSYRVGNFLRLYPDGRRATFDGEMMPLEVLEHEGRWGLVVPHE